MKKIALIEDDRMQVKALQGALEDGGFEVLYTSDGKTGLDMVLRQHPDLILLDLILPKLDGVSFIKELHKDDWGKQVPIILLTNLDDAQMIAKSVEQGVHDYLVKTDWKLEDVVQKVKEKLE
jgi:two-component system, OmpR family, alkaline phosphatase synthesis response regulator PhoP